MIKNEHETQSWQLNRKISLSFLVQLVFLASLIIGSWVNLQRQLDLLQRDVEYLCDCQNQMNNKLDSLTERTIGHEYRLRSVEESVSKFCKSELEGGKL
ncbi:MAG: hypothetical protein ACYTFM_08150 [Planctomycetota bacterium]